MPKGKFYLTQQGLERLKKEYQILKKVVQAKLNGKEIPPVFESEDINPEFLSLQEEVGFLESRLRDLEFILNNVEIIKPPPPQLQNVVNLGATVTLEVNGQIQEFQLVGSLEANPSLRKISVESPLGKALLGKKVGEEVILQFPQKVVYKITKIRYFA
jgi:transcription elongation factor GreA